MKMTNLAIENFLAITKAEFRLDDRGLVLIQGENEVDTSAKSNGAGKSSIADALCWCWFGTTARGVTGDDVINFDAGKGTKVSSSVVDGGLTYTATRHRKDKTHKNALTITVSNGLTVTDLTKGTDKLTQEVANQIIGASLEVFAGSIYAGQEQMPDLPAMTDKMLKLLIEEAAGTTVLEEAYRLARLSMGVAKANVDAAKVDVQRVTERKTWLGANLASVKAQSATWAANNKVQIDTLTAHAQTVVVPEARAAKVAVEAIDDAAILAAISTIEGRLAGVSGEQAALLAATQAAQRAQTAKQLAEVEFARANAALEAAHRHLSGISSKVGCPCDSCGRPMTEAELAVATTQANAQVNAAQEAKVAAEGKVAVAQAMTKTANDALEAQKTAMTDVSVDTAALTQERLRLADFEAKKRALTLAMDRAKQTREQIDTLKKAPDPYEAQIAQHERDLAAIDGQIATHEAALRGCEEAFAVEEQVVRIYAPAGVRARVLDEVTPFLNAQTAKYLATMSDGNIDATWTTLTPDSKGNLKEKFSIDVTNATGAKVFKGLSGGEKRKVRVATALALQDLVATRATKPIALFIADEIDDALDDSGLERLMTVLEEKARERGSVFIISHNSLKDWVRNVVTVKKTKTGTVVTETTL